MSGINILHLSDLHISSNRMSATSTNLLNDISIQTSDMDEIFLVVTGDIVDKGSYTKYKEGVMNFFRSLKEKIGKKVVGAYFVPGNHDKVRNISNELYGKLSQHQFFEMTKEIWDLQNENYESYISLIKQIKKMFRLKQSSKTKTFGVDSYEINDEIVCFIQMDTTWGTYGGNEDNGKLIIGKYQLESLFEQYQELRDKIEQTGKVISLTIGMGHHPINWLNPNEEKIVKKYMIDEEYFNMNLYLCGHIHDMDIENWYDGEHSIMTLVTGIGWNHQVEDSKEKDKKDEHRYSLYIIDQSKNSCDIIMRRSQKNGKFVSDYSVYLNDDEKKDKLCYPLKINNSNQPFINMNSPFGDLVKSLFVDTSMIQTIKNLHRQLMLYQKNLVHLLYMYQMLYIEGQEDIYGKGTQDYLNVCEILKNRFFNNDYKDSRTEKIFKKDIGGVYKNFTAYLNEVLVYFVNVFQECFPNSCNLRVHFRWYNQKEDKYIKLCQYSNVDKNEGSNVSDISWGGLIKQSYELENSLIYSVNKKYNNHEPVNWDDFLTVVPLFFKSEQEIRNAANEKMKRPIMTFGISVLGIDKKEDISKILYLLEYLDISQLITNTLDDYVRDFNVDYTKYLEYMDSIINKGDEK